MKLMGTDQPTLPQVEGYGARFRQAIGIMGFFILISLIHLRSSDYMFLINSVHVDIPHGEKFLPNKFVKEMIETLEDLDDKPTAPHIVLMVADDLGWNDISWHNPLVKSPNLESLARSGIILEQHYAQHICTPSRGALLTGREDTYFIIKIVYSMFLGILYILG